MDFCSYSLRTKTNKGHVTGGVSRVDDAQRSGAAVAPRLIQGTLQLANVQTPALLFVQIIVDLHRPEFGQRGRVQRILRDGDHDARARRALATHEQLQHRLGVESREYGGQGKNVGFMVLLNKTRIDIFVFFEI